MRGQAHLAIGAAAASALVSLAHAPDVAVVVGAAAALLPDIDHPRSTLGRRVGNLGLRHRGASHSVALGAVFSVVAGALASQLWSSQIAALLATAFFLGYLSHLAADLVNPTPMPLAWPFIRRSLRPSWLWGVPEDSIRGRLLEWAITGICVACIPLAIAPNAAHLLFGGLH